MQGTDISQKTQVSSKLISNQIKDSFDSALFLFISYFRAADASWIWAPSFLSDGLRLWPVRPEQFFLRPASCDSLRAPLKRYGTMAHKHSDPGLALLKPGIGPKPQKASQNVPAEHDLRAYWPQACSRG